LGGKASERRRVSAQKSSPNKHLILKKSRSATSVANTPAAPGTRGRPARLCINHLAAVNTQGKLSPASRVFSIHIIARPALLKHCHSSYKSLLWSRGDHQRTDGRERNPSRCDPPGFARPIHVGGATLRRSLERAGKLPLRLLLASYRS